MKKYACQYSIIRFTPFVETEEFANIGIAIYSPSTGKMEYKLAPTRFSRVTHFFDGLDTDLYKSVILRFKHELESLKSLLEVYPMCDTGTALFAETLRNKGSVVRFSDIRVVLTENIALKADELYEHYVGRSFVTKKYREQDMVRNVRNSLKQFKLDRLYKQVKLNDGITDVTLPLVMIAEDTPVSAIKPIAFDQSLRAKVVDHADLWLMKINRLAKNGAVEPENLLVTLDQPVTKDQKVRDYIREFERELTHLGVNTVPYDNTSAIIDFAKSKEPEKTAIPH